MPLTTLFKKSRGIGMAAMAMELGPEVMKSFTPLLRKRSDLRQTGGLVLVEGL